MRTSEFIKKIKDKGANINEYSNWWQIIKEDYSIAELNPKEVGRVNTNYGLPSNTTYEEKLELLEIVFEYVLTPIKERENNCVGKYKLKLDDMNIHNDDSYLKYITSSGTYCFGNSWDSVAYQSAFTNKEIERLPSFIKCLLTGGFLVKELAEEE